VCPLNSANIRLHTRSPMIDTSQRKAFCDARKTLKSIFGRGPLPDPAGGPQDAPSEPSVEEETPISFQGIALSSDICLRDQSRFTPTLC